MADTLPESVVMVRRALPEDASAIVEFNRAMALETEHKELPLARIAPGVEHLFEHPEYGFYLVVEAGTEAIGGLLITFEWSDWRNGLIWWIQSVYVRPQWRARGVFRRLYDTVKILAAETGGVRGLRLYVEKNNRIAQKTYTALGMEETYYRLFEEMFQGGE